MPVYPDPQPGINQMGILRCNLCSVFIENKKVNIMKMPSAISSSMISTNKPGTVKNNELFRPIRTIASVTTLKKLLEFFRK